MLVRAIGEVDIATVPMLWSNLKAMLEDNLNVVVDLNGVEYIDACGIQAFLDIHRLFIQCGQRFVLAQPTRLFSTLLREIAGFEHTIPFFTSVAAALASFNSLPRCYPAWDTEMYKRHKITKPNREDVHGGRQ